MTVPTHIKRNELNGCMLLVVVVAGLLFALNPLRIFMSMKHFLTTSVEHSTVNRITKVPGGGMLVSSVQRLDNWREISYYAFFTYQPMTNAAEEVFGTELLKRKPPSRVPIILTNGSTIVVAVTNYMGLDALYLRPPHGHWRKQRLDRASLMNGAGKDTLSRKEAGRIVGFNTEQCSLNIEWADGQNQGILCVAKNGDIRFEDASLPAGDTSTMD